MIIVVLFSMDQEMIFFSYFLFVHYPLLSLNELFYEY